MCSADHYPGSYSFNGFCLSQTESECRYPLHIHINRFGQIYSVQVFLIHSCTFEELFPTCAKLAEWLRGCLQSSSTPVQIGNLALGFAAIAERFHPDPFRTRQLSSLTLTTVLRYASSRELVSAAPPFFFLFSIFLTKGHNGKIKFQNIY